MKTTILGGLLFLVPLAGLAIILSKAYDLSTMVVTPIDRIIPIETIAGAAPKLVKHSVDDQSGVGAQFVTTDINGDGQTDIVVSNRKGVFVFEQKW